MQILAEGIIECGRGPEIAGSRITVYDVFDESNAGLTVPQLASEWHLTVEQIERALKYIEDHREEVVRQFAEIKAWHARERVLSQERVRQRKRTGPPPANPELWAKFQRLKAEWEARRAWNPGGSQPSGTNGTGEVDPRKSDLE